MQKVADRKPEVKGGEVYATDKGWEVKHASGVIEVLVSCKGLKSFIDSQAQPVIVEEQPKVEEVQEEVKQETPRQKRSPKAK
jgi:hypothetical protein